MKFFKFKKFIYVCIFSQFLTSKFSQFNPIK